MAQVISHKPIVKPCLLSKKITRNACREVSCNPMTFQCVYVLYSNQSWVVDKANIKESV